MDDKQRAAFEAWIKTHCDYDDLDRSEMMLAFDAWQAALASPEVQALIVEAYERGLQDGRREGDDFIAGCLA